MKLFPRSHSRFHEDLCILSTSRQKSDQKGFWNNINRRVRKESRTEMESTTFKTLETAQDLANIILFDVIQKDET